MLLEMRILYYKTLVGSSLAEMMVVASRPSWNQFVGERLDCHRSFTAATEFLCARADAIADEALAAVTEIMNDVPLSHAGRRRPGFPLAAIAAQYLATVFGSEADAELDDLLRFDGAIGAGMRLRTPLGCHSLDPHSHRFDFDRLVRPIPPDAEASPDAYGEALVAYMKSDLAQADQDNLRNPTKAACDGVWRDLRSVLVHAIDQAGLTAASHQLFLARYMPIHNRLGNGASRDVMEKILALIQAGIVDASTGPEAEPVVQDGQLFIKGSRTGALKPVSALVESWVHPFDVQHQALPLYRNLLDRGLVRPWMNPAAGGAGFEPGGIDVTPDHHPVGRDGGPVYSLTVVGAPTEGRFFYPIGAARPRQNHHVLNDVIRCHDAWLKRVPSECYERIRKPAAIQTAGSA
jgi:hypothetical protein